MRINLMKTLFALLLFSITTVSAQEAGQYGAESDQATENAAKNSKPDMTELFGPDYKKGDIGHSFGTIQSISIADQHMTIDHSTIHGIDADPAVTQFEILASAETADLAEGVKVEFLVKKGADAIYRILAICELASDGSSCL